MPTNDEATPRPWKLDRRNGSWAIYPASEDYNCLSGMSEWAIVDSGKKGYKVPGPHGDEWTLPPETVANAALIVRAVNAHDGLVDCVEACHAWITTKMYPPLNSHETAMVELMQVALAAAKGDTPQ